MVVKKEDNKIKHVLLILLFFFSLKLSTPSLKFTNLNLIKSSNHLIAHHMKLEETLLINLNQCLKFHFQLSNTTTYDTWSD